MNPYKILGVAPSSTKDEIKSAYAKLSADYNIENFKGSTEEVLAEDKLYELNEAYTSIINDFKYKDIRSLIETEQFISAENELNLISDKNSAEWNYLKGFVMLKKGWIQAGVTHLKTATELSPTNTEYKESLALLSKKLTEMRMNYMRMQQRRNSSSNNDLCGGGSNDMCGGGSSQGSGGGGIDPNMLNMLMNSMGGNASGAMPNGAMNGMPNGNPMQGNPMQGNPMQNMLMQSLMGGGGGNMMNMCGNGGGKMC